MHEERALRVQQEEPFQPLKAEDMGQEGSLKGCSPQCQPQKSTWQYLIKSSALHHVCSFPYWLETSTRALCGSKAKPEVSRTEIKGIADLRTPPEHWMAASKPLFQKGAFPHSSPRCPGQSEPLPGACLPPLKPLQSVQCPQAA